MAAKKSGARQKKNPVQPHRSSDHIKIGASAAIAFLVTMLLAGDIIKQTALFMLLLTVTVVLFADAKKVGENRLCAPLYAMAAYVLINGISTFYALSGKFAINEFGKILVSFAVYILIVFINDGSFAAVRNTLTVFAASTAAVSFFSIEAASTAVLYRVLCVILRPISDVFSFYGAFEEGTRISSVLGNPNVFASVVALGTLFSLYLVGSSKGKKQQLLSCILLSVNALGLLLSFSMGATAIFLLSAVVYLLLSDAGKRGQNLVLMVETAVLTLIMTGVSYVGLGRAGQAISVLPVLAVLSEGVLLYLVHSHAGIKVSERLAKSGKKVLLTCGGVLLFFAIYAVAALNLTSPYDFSEGEALRRGAYPAAGEYQLDVGASGDVSVTIESQDQKQVMMHTSTVLYSGPAQGAAFTVPEGSRVVYFNFTAGAGTSLSEASYGASGGMVGRIKLNYTLLPGFIANRLQGLNANQNAIQRTVFFDDGLKLFYRSSLFGLGLGSFEDAIKGVQSFYYETKYAHNHYIQMLVDCGLVGLGLFLFLILSSAFLLIKGRKRRSYDDIFPALFAALVMLSGHCAVEVSMSAAPYLPFAFALFALIVVCFGDGSAAVIKNKKRAFAGLRIGTIVFSSVFILLLTGNLIAQNMLKTVTAENLYQRMDAAVKLDIYEKNDYLITYVMNSVNSRDQEVQSRADEYAEILSTQHSNVIQKALTSYYFAKDNSDKAFEMARSAAVYTASDPDTWTALFDSFEANFDPTGTDNFTVVNRVQDQKDYYVQHILELYDMLLQHNKESMEKIRLTTKNMIFLGKVLEIRDMDSDKQSAEILNVLSNKLFDSDYALDLDENGVPDLIAGDIKSENGRLTLNGTAELSVKPKLFGAYKLIIRSDRQPDVSTDFAQPDVRPGAEAGETVATFELVRNGDGSDNTVRLSGENITISSIELLREAL